LLQVAISKLHNSESTLCQWQSGLSSCSPTEESTSIPAHQGSNSGVCPYLFAHTELEVLL